MNYNFIVKRVRKFGMVLDKKVIDMAEENSL